MTHIADSPISTPVTESWSFAKVHSPVADGLRQTRMEAVQAGLTPVGQGMAFALTVLAEAVNARTMVEIDTVLGASTLPLLVGMTSGRVLTSIDSEADNQLPARSFLNAADYPPSCCRLIAGAPLEILLKLRGDAHNIVFINGDRLEHVEYMVVVLCLLRPGSLLIIHDVL